MEEDEGEGDRGGEDDAEGEDGDGKGQEAVDSHSTHLATGRLLGSPLL